MKSNTILPGSEGHGWRCIKIYTTLALLFSFSHLNAQWSKTFPEIMLQPLNYNDPRFEVFDIDDKTLIISQDSGFVIDEAGNLKFLKSLNNNSPFNNHSYSTFNGSLYQGIKFSSGMQIRRYDSNLKVLDSVFLSSDNLFSDGFAITDSLIFVVLYENFNPVFFYKNFILAGFDPSGEIKYRKIIEDGFYDLDEIYTELKEVAEKQITLQFKNRNDFWSPLVSVLWVIDVSSGDEYYPDYVNYKYFYQSFYDGGYTIPNDTVYLTVKSGYSTGISIIDKSQKHIGTHLFSHIGDIWSNQIDYNDGIIGTLSTSNEYIVFRCLDELGQIINEEIILHECESVFHPNYGHYASFAKNDIGGFTFGYSAIDFKEYGIDALFYPHIFKTDSTCQVQHPNVYRPKWVESIKASTAKAYPNPSTGVFRISNPDSELIQVFDATGRFILDSKSQEIDLSGRPDGMYFIKLDREVFRVIKQ